MNEALEAARRALAGTEAWVVGGVVRDTLLSRETEDVDLVVGGEPEVAARALAREAGAAVFPLSEAFGAWRVVAREGSWHADVSPLAGGSIEADLGRRDFTINAMARRLGDDALIDPWGGGADLAAGRLRMVSTHAFSDDPLRALRLARLACELGFESEPDTTAAARTHAARIAGVAQERVFAELRRIVTAPRALAGLAAMETVGLTPVVLPELTAMRGVQQSAYHHLDVHDHTLAVLQALIDLEADPEPAFGGLAPAVSGVLAEPLADELSRGGALRFGALLHDAAKPATRAVTAEGRVTFYHHDRAGAELARSTLTRLKTSERLRSYVAAVTRHHLRLGFLVHERPLAPRTVYRYLDACDPVEVDVTALSVADRLATRGHKADEAIAVHLELAREMMAAALRWRADGRPRPLLRGDEVAQAAGIAAGPIVGKVLAELAEAQFAGEIADREDALRLARELAARLDPPAAG
jgi:putative nucleotidyltransferase with HDIG domain